MKIYFDMDGVLSDLYGTISKAWGIPQEEIFDHSEEATQRYRIWVLEPPGATEIFASLPPLHLEDIKSLMVELNLRGHSVEILSSLGISQEFQQGPAVQAGKERWLQEHLGDFLESGILRKINFVNNGSEKKAFANGDSILIDDTGCIINDFIENSR